MAVGIIKSAWRYRGFIVSSVKREFQSRYRNSLLGGAWMIINPLAMIFVYTVIFSQLMRARLPGVDSNLAYSVYLCAGSLTWGLFADTLTRAQNVFLEQANLIKKLSFPRICLPIIVALNALLNFGIVFGLFTIFLLVSNNFPGWSYFALIPVLLLQVAFSMGLGIVLGVLNVFFRDVGQLFGVVMQFWFWFTPIVYPITVLPERVRHYIMFNPMARVITAYQDICVWHRMPNWYSLWPVLALAVLLCVAGAHIFRRHSAEMVDEL
ncbi:ABC transporter permease [Burkholderia latens]|uniref:ABC transporter permease n=1 Tax=Burkholderia latens TaxID=488446 RepID=UPI00158C8AFB|nr:ABC transporter permease [Burkholderia latens]